MRVLASPWTWTRNTRNTRTRNMWKNKPIIEAITKTYQMSPLEATLGQILILLRNNRLMKNYIYSHQFDKYCDGSASHSLVYPVIEWRREVRHDCAREYCKDTTTTRLTILFSRNGFAHVIHRMHLSVFSNENTKIAIRILFPTPSQRSQSIMHTILTRSD